MRTLVCVMFTAAGLAAQQPPKIYTPTEPERQQIEAKTAELGDLLRKVESNPLYADAAIYREGGRVHPEDPERVCNGGICEGHAGGARHRNRAREGTGGGHARHGRRAKGRIVRAYRSKVDGSLQPYGLIIPESYTGQPIRLDVWLHGMNRNLNEVSFIKGHEGAAPVPADQQYIQLDVYGRSNVAYRWAGETDVFEALPSVEERYRIDPEADRAARVLDGRRGRVASRACIIPTSGRRSKRARGSRRRRITRRRADLPPYQEAALHYYDAVDYSLNGMDVPFVGYGGEIDPQLQASKNIKEQLLKEGVNLETCARCFWWVRGWRTSGIRRRTRCRSASSRRRWRRGWRRRRTCGS